jgi:hypothetical protein
VEYDTHTFQEWLLHDREGSLTSTRPTDIKHQLNHYLRRPVQLTGGQRFKSPLLARSTVRSQDIMIASLHFGRGLAGYVYNSLIH